MTTTLPPTPEFAALRAVSEPAPVALPRRVPGVRSPASAEMLARLGQLRDVLGGIRTLRARGERYLPKLSGESATDYEFRLELANFFNTPRRTVKAVAGLICQRAPTIGEDGDGADTFKAHWEAIDDRGNHGRVFVRRFVEDGTAVGFAGILVDMPQTPEGRLSLADVERLRVRPYWVPIQFEQVYDADWVMLGAERVCVYLELQETVQRREAGTRGRVTIERFRVFERAVTRDAVTGLVTAVGDPTVQLWEQRAGEGEPQPVGASLPLRAQGGRPLSRIPFVPCVVGDLEDDGDVWIVRSPIQDMVDLSLSWYQTYAERRNLENRCCTATLWMAGYVPERDPATGKDKPVQIGASQVLLVSENGKVGYAAPPGDAFEPTRQSLEDLERRIGVVGIVKMLFGGEVGKTEAGEQNENAPQLGILSAIADAVEDCLEAAAEIHGEYIGQTAPSISLNRYFERLTANPAMIAALSDLAFRGQISTETLLMELERWRVLPDGFDVAAEVERLRTLPSAAPAASAAPATGSVQDRMAQALAAASVAPVTPPADLAPAPDVAPAAGAV